MKLVRRQLPRRFCHTVATTASTSSATSAPASASSNSGCISSECGSSGSCDHHTATATASEADSVSFNPVGIQMLSGSLHRRIFGQQPVAPAPEQVERARAELRRHGLLPPEQSAAAPTTVLPVAPDLQFPPLHGSSLDDHFRHIASEQTAPYRRLIDRLMAADLPAPPAVWSRASGWTRYHADGSVQPQAYPDADVLVLDVEVVVRRGLVVMATAVSPDAWYSWLSPVLGQALGGAGGAGGSSAAAALLLAADTGSLSLDHLVPVDGRLKRPRLVIGHNVGFDRSWIREQYLLQTTGTRFLDTMSMHVAVGGITSMQRAQLLRKQSDDSPTGATAKTTPRRQSTAYPPMEWFAQSSLNSLSDVHRLYCGSALDKHVRSVFVHGDVADVVADFDRLISYCADDVSATWRVFRQLWPHFVDRFPHPVTLAGTLEMGQSYLPVSDHWTTYVGSCQETYADLLNELHMALCRVANDACRFAVDGRYRDDPWLWDLDWSHKVLKMKKAPAPRKRAKKTTEPPASETAASEAAAAAADWCAGLAEFGAEETLSGGDSEQQEEDPLDRVFEPLWQTSSRLYKVQSALPGYPAWYTALCSSSTSLLDLLSSSKRCVPKLLRLTWLGYPLHHDPGHGWGYLVPGRPPHELDNTAFPLEALQQLLAAGGHALAASALSADHASDDSDELDDTEYWRRRRRAARGRQRQQQQQPLPVHMGATAVANVRVRGCWFFALPHRNGVGHNVGNPLAKHFLASVQAGTLASAGSSLATRVLRITQAISYWRNSRARITAQRPVFLRPCHLPRSVTAHCEYTAGSAGSAGGGGGGGGGGGRYGAIVPAVCVSGTLTRRAVERTWLTASNVDPNRLGSELRAMVHAPPGHRIVGADVDSQELWIASLLGDAGWAGVQGGTAFSWMTLQGSRAAGTDLHSRTAAVAGVTRSVAKVLNYGRIYGGARHFATQLLRQAGGSGAGGAGGGSGSDAELQRRVAAMYSATKGQRAWRLNEAGRAALRRLQLSAVELAADSCSSGHQADDPLLSRLLDAGGREPLTTACVALLARVTGAAAHWRHLVAPGRSLWSGGTESHMFNQLERIANNLHPATPVLAARMSRGLEPAAVGDAYATSRINWVVQSSAVDFLHAMLVCMRWLAGEAGLSARLAISVHDEVRYLAASGDAERVALALHITNLLTRSLFVSRLGMSGLPLSVAFFSAVDIDRTLRKHVHDDCVTPSNSDGLSAGYGVAAGQSLDIHQLVQRVGTSLLPPTRQ